MSINSPYQTPQSEITNAGELEFANIEMFSTSQRIGRIRWLAYTSLLYLIVGMAGAIIMPLMGATGINQLSGFGLILLVLIYVFMMFAAFVLARRRLHDLDKTGWMVLILFIPVIGLFFALYLIIAPGTPGSNRFGAKPVPNTVLTWIGGLFLPMIMIIGILAAIALPAYNDYVARAKAAQTQPQD